MGKLLTPSNLKFVKFELKNLDEYLKKIQAAGKNVEDAVKEAVKHGGVPIYDDIKGMGRKA